jgi:uracil-DNA glycosylase
MGMSFSVPKTVKCPPSLAQMYKCLFNDKEIDFEIPNGGPNGRAHGDLTKWANQGVFLLNAILTVQ